MSQFYKRKYRFFTFPGQTTLNSIENYLENLDFHESIVSFSQTTHGMTVLIEYQELVEEE